MWPVGVCDGVVRAITDISWLLHQLYYFPSGIFLPNRMSLFPISKPIKAVYSRGWIWGTIRSPNFSRTLSSNQGRHVPYYIQLSFHNYFYTWECSPLIPPSTLSYTLLKSADNYTVVEEVMCCAGTNIRFYQLAFYHSEAINCVLQRHNSFHRASSATR